MKHERIFDQDGIGDRVHPRVLRSEEPTKLRIFTRTGEFSSNVDLKQFHSAIKRSLSHDPTRFRLRGVFSSKPMSLVYRGF